MNQCRAAPLSNITKKNGDNNKKSHWALITICPCSPAAQMCILRYSTDRILAKLLKQWSDTVVGNFDLSETEQEKAFCFSVVASVKKSPISMNDSFNLSGEDLCLFPSFCNVFWRRISSFKGPCLFFCTLLNHFHWGCHKNRTRASINYMVLLLHCRLCSQKERKEMSLEKDTWFSWGGRTLVCGWAEHGTQEDCVKERHPGAVSRRHWVPGDFGWTNSEGRWLNKDSRT